MDRKLFFDVTALIREMIISPKQSFDKIKAGTTSVRAIYSVLLLAALITLLKAFFASWRKTFDFFDSQYLNNVVIILNNPYIMWLREWLVFFITLFLLVKSCKLLFKAECDKLPYMLMAISVIGLLCQILFLPLNYLLPHDSLKLILVAFYIWNLILIFIAIRIAGLLSYAKTTVVLLMVIIVFFISPFGLWSFMTPYFLFAL